MDFYRLDKGSLTDIDINQLARAQFGYGLGNLIKVKY